MSSYFYSTINDFNGNFNCLQFRYQLLNTPELEDNFTYINTVDDVIEIVFENSLTDDEIIIC